MKLVTDAPLRVEHLTKRYRNVAAAEDVTFDVHAGEVFGFLGPNGAGKTTTLRCALGFIRATSGSVSILGKPIPERLSDALEHVGYLPGDVGYWPWLTGEQTLDHLASLHPHPPVDRASLLDRFELSARDLGRPVRAYSRGMRQKLALVQAFQHRPQLAILDEPTEGLDPLMQDRFLELARELRDEGRTVLMSSHILAEVEAIADRVGIIRKGRLVALGTPREIAPDRRRRCVVEFQNPTDLTLLQSIDGVSDLTGLSDTRYHFLFSGDVPELMATIMSRGITDVTIEPPSLTESFMGFYEEESE